MRNFVLFTVVLAVIIWSLPIIFQATAVIDTVDYYDNSLIGHTPSGTIIRDGLYRTYEIGRRNDNFVKMISPIFVLFFSMLIFRKKWLRRKYTEWLLETGSMTDFKERDRTPNLPEHNYFY